MHVYTSNHMYAIVLNGCNKIFVLNLRYPMIEQASVLLASAYLNE